MSKIFLDFTQFFCLFFAISYISVMVATHLSINTAKTKTLLLELHVFLLSKDFTSGQTRVSKIQSVLEPSSTSDLHTFIHLIEALSLLTGLKKLKEI